MSTNKKPRSVFSSVINDLVRSAIGEKGRQVPDQDLDSYVADLITKEARAKQSKYKTEGVRAYQPTPPSSSPLKPNKRFLMNIIKQTDSHNQAVIREAEENAIAFQKKLRRKEAQESDYKGKRRLSHQDDYNTHTMKRKRKPEDDGNSDDQHSDSISTTSVDSESSSNDKAGPIQFRGRGKIRNGSSMDKYFDDRYDATKDVDSDTDTLNPVTKKKKDDKTTHHKLHKDNNNKKKKKKKKHRHRSSKKAKKATVKD
ncbi:hypothetical protein BC941DRAFT_513426 [Chlamydoabsidia padenii]|nr:hypothetical protein BC941DRAFT_513426 [Chlamydoabsidia padenii]